MSNYQFDPYGWYAGESARHTAYTTDQKPPDPTGDKRAMWTGSGWVLKKYESAVDVATTSKRVTKLQYLNLFTDTELANIYAAADTDAGVRVWVEKFNAATPEADGTCIDMRDPQTIEGLTKLNAAKLITDARLAEILA